MGKTLEWALQCSVHDSLCANPGLVRRIVEHSVRINSGDYPTSLIESVVQKFADQADIYDGFAFASVIQMIRRQKLIWIDVEVGSVPSRDENYEINNLRLSKLPSSLRARFEGGLGDFDGLITVDPSVLKFSSSRPMIIPLEVGYTSATTTLGHILFRGGVARWPHGSAVLTLLVLSESGRSSRIVAE